MGNNITFSVIVTAYNIQEYIAIAINSILKQTYLEFEIIVVDDGSSDATVNVASKLLNKVENARVITTPAWMSYYYSSQTLGYVRNSNVLFSEISALCIIS